jgi:hypothetical protein
LDKPKREKLREMDLSARAFAGSGGNSPFPGEFLLGCFRAAPVAKENYPNFLTLS